MIIIFRLTINKKGVGEIHHKKGGWWVMTNGNSKNKKDVFW
jgi:hypothetical protein